jgi:hypothetical protein
MRTHIIDKYISANRFDVSCNSIKNTSPISEYKKTAKLELSRLLSESLCALRSAQQSKLFYLISEWAKLSLFLTFCLSQFDKDSRCTDLKAFNLFEICRNPNFEIDEPVDFNLVSGSIGFLFDEVLSIFWVLTVSFDAKLIIFKSKVENLHKIIQSFNDIADICSQNTESLRNTKEISTDSTKKAQWWKLRRSLDSNLISVCSSLQDDLFTCISVFAIIFVFVLLF